MCRTPPRFLSQSHTEIVHNNQLAWREHCKRMVKLPPSADLKVRAEEASVGLLSVLQVYGALALVTLMALLITFTKIKMVEMMAGSPESSVTFKPVKQRTGSSIMYTGNGFMPEDWYFFHSGVCFLNSFQK